jgi:hypothetical protein
MQPAESAVDVLVVLGRCVVYGIAGMGIIFVIGTLSAYAAGCLITNSWNPFERRARDPHAPDQPRDPYQ